jgi:hypothetical protein
MRLILTVLLLMLGVLRLVRRVFISLLVLVVLCLLGRRLRRLVPAGVVRLGIGLGAARLL